MMNKKARIFQEYLESQNITCFAAPEEIADAVNTVAFRSFLEVEGQRLPVMVLADSSIYTLVRVRVAAQAVHEENELALARELNRLNAQQKLFKYYLADDGALILDSCVPEKPEELDGDMVYTVLHILLKHLEDEYKNIMQAVWG